MTTLQTKSEQSTNYSLVWFFLMSLTKGFAGKTANQFHFHNYNGAAIISLPTKPSNRQAVTSY